MTPCKYYEDIPIMYNITSVKDIPGYHLSTTIFDTAWAAILALNKSIELLHDRNMSVDFLVKNEGNISVVNPVVLDVVNISLSQVRFLDYRLVKLINCKTGIFGKPIIMYYRVQWI